MLDIYEIRKTYSMSRFSLDLTVYIVIYASCAKITENDFFALLLNKK